MASGAVSTATALGGGPLQLGHMIGPRGPLWFWGRISISPAPDGMLMPAFRIASVNPEACTMSGGGGPPVHDDPVQALQVCEAPAEAHATRTGPGCPP